jgi:hypothetical protein
MAAPVAAIHVFIQLYSKDVEGRNKSGHDVNDQRNARFSESTRSVRSHEKPPSLSGARPKWP